MAKNRGWWQLTLTGNSVNELNDTDLEHIAQCIIDGYTQGEIVEDEK